MNLDQATVFTLSQRIHEAGGPKAVIYAAGGGTEVFPWLLGRGGGSATLLSGRIPYDPADFRSILGADPGRLVTARAARGLAMAAFRHGLQLRPDLGHAGVVGIGATAKLAQGLGERPGRTHELHLALQTSERTLVRSITLKPGSRSDQEQISALAILNLVAEARGVPGLPLPGAPATDLAASAATCGHPDLPSLLAGQRPWVAYHLDGASTVAAAVTPTREPTPTRVLLPGSFRPLHEGHLRMATLAAAILGEPCSFELALFHPEKPPLDYVSIADRVGRFVGVAGWLLLTDAPTYRDKARLFPGSTFVVGHDTALRIVEPRWYGGVAARDAMLDELEALGARFLVFGRVDVTGRFRNLSHEAFEDDRVARFIARSTRVVAEADFRLDLSSTGLRLAAETEFP